MNERIAFGAMVLLLAAHALAQTRSPAFAALAGTYEAVSGDGSSRYVLVLGSDGTASVRSLSPDGGRVLASETGAWILDGKSVQIGLEGASEGHGAQGATLEARDGALVAAGGDESASRFAGLTFTRSDEGRTTPTEN